MKPKNQQIMLTCLCGRQFKLKSSFTKHQNYDCNLFRETPVHQCPDCGVKFTQERNLIRHMKKNCTSKISISTSKKLYSCSFQGCNIRFYKLTSLANHVEYFHNVEIRTKEFIFLNYDEFLKWKQREEQLTFSYFSKRHSAPASNGDLLTNDQKAFYETYYCQFHGSEKPHHQIKSVKKNKKGRSKTGMICYAHMFVKVELDKSVKVKYVSTHTHPLVPDNTKFQPLPQILKNEILQLNSLNVPFNEIHKRITRCDISRENRNNPIKGREYFVKLHNIRYLLKSVGEKNEEADETVTISNIISDWSNESHNPILIYKPQGESISIEPDLDLPQNDFLFGFQTKKQIDVMLSQNILFFEFLYDSEGYGAQILTIAVALESTEYPIANFILSNTDENTLALCLTALKQKSPSFFLKSVIASDARIFNIVKDIFNKDCQCYFCHTFVLNQWSRKLSETVKDESLHAEIMSELLNILKETSEEQFMIQTQYFCMKYNSALPSFVNYFKSYYLKTEHLPSWSSVFRQIPIHSNAPVDAFHNFLKEKYLKRITEKTLDKLVIAIAESEKDYYAKGKELDISAELNSTEVNSSKVDTQFQNEVCDIAKEQNLMQYEEPQVELINHNKLQNINDNLSKLSVLLGDKLIQEKCLDHIDQSLEHLVKDCLIFKSNETELKSGDTLNINVTEFMVSELIEQEVVPNKSIAKENNLLFYQLQDHLYCISQPGNKNNENLDIGGEIVISENPENDIGPM